MTSSTFPLIDTHSLSGNLCSRTLASASFFSNGSPGLGGVVSGEWWIVIQSCGIPVSEERHTSDTLSCRGAAALATHCHYALTGGGGCCPRRWMMTRHRVVINHPSSSWTRLESSRVGGSLASSPAAADSTTARGGDHAQDFATASLSIAQGRRAPFPDIDLTPLDLRDTQQCLSQWSLSRSLRNTSSLSPQRGILSQGCVR